MRNIILASVMAAILVGGVVAGWMSHAALAQDGKDGKEKQKDKKESKEDPAVTKLEKEIKDLKERNDALEKQLEKANRSEKGLAKDVDSLRKDLKELGMEKAELVLKLAMADKVLEKEKDLLSKKLKQTEAASEKLRGDVRALTNDKRDLAQKVKVLGEEEQTLKKAISELENMIATFSPNSKIVKQNPKRFSDEKKELVVGFHPGKRNEAEQLCEAMGFKFVDVVGPDKNLLLYRWTRPVTQETLNILGQAKSVIRLVQPQSPAEPQEGRKQFGPDILSSKPNSKASDRLRLRDRHLLPVVFAISDRTCDANVGGSTIVRLG